ncbi:KRSC protein, partial [Centropus bengalensis]|nr:KRSC protein [Centropus bengalensis]
MSCYDLCSTSACGVARPQPLADSFNEPCVRQCPDSTVVIQPPPAVVTLPGPILSSFPQQAAVGSAGAPVLPASGVSAGYGALWGNGGYGYGGLYGYGGYGSLGYGGLYGSGGYGSLGYGGLYGCGGYGSLGYRGLYGYGRPYGAGYCSPYSYRSSRYGRGICGPC